MGKRKLGALEKVEVDLANLQYKIRRDPPSYVDDFNRQWQQYETHYAILCSNPSSAGDNGIITTRDLIDFVAHVAECYPATTQRLPEDLAFLLRQHHESLEADLREKVVGSLVLLRNKDIIDSYRLFDTLFPVLISTSSKPLRTFIYAKIVSDIRTANSKTKNHKLNTVVQKAFFELVVTEGSSGKALWAARITRELWRRQVWTEARAAEIMREASISDNERLILSGVQFFLGGDKEREVAAEESSDQDDSMDVAKLRHQAGINKATGKRDREMKKAIKSVKRRERKKQAPHLLNFSALHLLHDPQGFAETLFTKHLQSQKSKLNLAHKLMVLQLVSRLVGLHQLTIVTLYSYFVKYLTPRQPSVTTFLACLAQATHPFVPPDTLEPLVQKIANEFVSEAAAAEVASAGLNAIREVCTRQPLAMNETLLQDLVQYRKSKDKGVVMAARGLLGLYRNVGAEMLNRRDRGREAAIHLRDGTGGSTRFGEVELGGIDGLDLLEAWKENERKRKREERGQDGSDSTAATDEEEQAGWDNWDVESNDSDDSGGWIDVESDGDDIHLSDSDDGRPSAKKAKPSLTAEPESSSHDVAHPSASTAPLPRSTPSMATTRILTPADLAKLQELRKSRDVTALLPSHRSQRARPQSHDTTRHHEDPLTAAEIEGLAALSHKTTKAEKVALAKGDQEKHQSTTARRKEKKRAEGKSTSNKEKERQKNFLMTLGKAKRKNKRSLGDVRKALRGHVERSKRGGRKGNR